MNIISAHSPKYNLDGSITLQVLFESLPSEVPFNAISTDTEEHGTELFSRAASGEYGEVTPYSFQMITLEQTKISKLQELSNEYKSDIVKPVSYMNTTFQADSDSQDLISKCLVAGSLPNGFFWLDSNNVSVSMSFSELQGLALAILTQGQLAFVKLQTLKASVNLATDIVVISAITW